MTLKARLATGGDCLKVWECNEPVFEYKPKSNVEAISWSYDGSCIASLSTSNDKITMTYLKSNGPTSVEIPTTLGVSPQKVQFPKTSNNCLIIGSKSAVFLYDLSKQKSRKEFKLQNDVNIVSLSSNCNDTHIAAGSGVGSGQIYMLSCVTGLIGPPLKSTMVDSVTSVKFSNIRQSILGSCGETGQVALWDCNASKTNCVFREHKAPVTGIAFSQVNEVLFLSCGLDKRCIFYDSNSKRPASTVRSDYPLTAVDYFSDGFTLALGTTSGKILIYDLRSFKSPVSVLTGHSGNVKVVQYQPPFNERTPKGSTTKSLSSSKLSTQVSLKNLAQSIKENFPTISESSSVPFQADTYTTLSPISNGALGRKDSLGSQIFSPIRDVGDFGSPQLDNKVKQSSAVSTPRLSNGSVFSPLRENSSNLSHTGFSPKESNQSEGPCIFSAGDLIPTQENVSRNDVLTTCNIAKKDLPDTPLSLGVTSTTKIFNQEARVESSETMKYLSVPSPPKKRRSLASGEGKSFSDVKNLLTAFPAVIDNFYPERVPESEAASKKKDSPSSDGKQFQDNYLRNTVADTMEEFCFDMRKHLWHIQYDMIRNFQDQRSELSGFLHLYELNDQLLSEVERLREENETLRQSPFLTAFDVDP